MILTIIISYKLAERKVNQWDANMILSQKELEEISFLFSQHESFCDYIEEKVDQDEVDNNSILKQVFGYHRFRVLDITFGTFTDTSSKVIIERNQMILHLLSSEKEEAYFAHLRQEWYPSAIQDDLVNCGDIVNIIGQFDEQKHCIIDDKENFIIVNPDLLVSVTSVSSAVACDRRSVLSEKFRVKSSSNRDESPLHYGVMRHFFFEIAVSENNSSTNFLCNAVFFFFFFFFF